MEKPPSLVLRNVSLPDGRVADISTAGGIVTHAGEGVPSDRDIDCNGMFVLPAAVDMHVHMRGGAQSAKEDWESGTKSALAGGVTVVVDQPNTVPPLTTPEAFHARVLAAKESAFCTFAVNSGVTRDTSLSAMWSAGAMAFGEIFYAPSSYGEAVTLEYLCSAFDHIRSLGGLATIHAEEVGPGPDTTLESHAGLRSPEGELRAVRTVLQANTAGCRLHFCHMSAGPSAGAASQGGSVEVTPHHLFLSREMCDTADTFAKVNPPLRSERERKELFAQWNRIDVIASDHAPHTVEEKRQPFADAPSGVPGVETMVPLLLAAVLEKKISLPDVIAKTSSNPAAILRIPQAGFAPGSRADFALYPKTAEKIDAGNLHSRCGWTPFEGMKGVFPSHVIMDGTVVFEDGEFFRTGPAWIPGDGYFPR
ncbi:MULTISPECIES: dihydroorotase [unclassified Methanoregula]|uniref:dihydroorotase n=1 Tax=unclassified Methanoregula TaxID=2649730 RepID=UPI0009D4B443|nr:MULTISPECIES: dihydroorotase [unclassified Methanoregula]OPX62928.1 MAG: dihydroorotase [Methanoregula sp. PtaB.Bin085]OPY35141.1 MAG: dihydroorotase [Methanoregula sp. PtaU1.Bin006]